MLFIYLFVLAFIGFLSKKVYIALLGPLKDIPGPLLAKFTRLWEWNALRPGDFEVKLAALHLKHGPIVRIGPNKCSVDDPNAIKTLYPHGRPLPKTSYYYAFRLPAVTNLFGEQNPKVHGDMRRKVASLYSLTSLLSYEGFIDGCTATLERKLAQFYAENRPVDMGKYLQFYAFDVIGAITAGSPFGLMEREHDDGVIANIHGSARYGAFVGIVPELHYWCQKYFQCVATLTRRLSARAAAFDFVGFHVQQRRKGVTPNDKNDFLTKLLKLEEDGTNTHFHTQLACRSNIIAGSDTTGISLAGIMYHLLKNPDKMAKLQDEIDAGVVSGKVSDPITFKESQDMPYLQACIKEGLRIHPAISVVLARSVLEGGAEVCGKYLPQNTEVGVNPWVTNHNKDVFTDPYAFRPERWLAPKEQTQKMEAYFATFGFGSRTCIGKHISLLELGKVIPQLVRKYDFKFEPFDADWKVQTYMFTKAEYRCNVSPRGLKA